MRSAFLFLVVAGLSACAGTDRPVGSNCSESDQCASGLSCLEVTMVTGEDGGTCVPMGKACTIPCTVDEDCSHLPDNAQCFPGCAGPATCEPTF